jgi:hypothetical protein
MPGLIDFTTAFDGQAGFFTGTGITDLVPHVFPVALNGRPYMLDTRSREFNRQFDARVRDSVDQSAEPGEQAINPQGLWRRSQSSWHYGAGQTYSDTADAEPYRFRSSKGIDVWQRGQLSLLQDTDRAYASTETNLFMATAGDRIYGVEGQTLRFTSDWVSFTTVTGTPASRIAGIASDGFNVWTSHENGTIYRTDTSGSASTSYVTGILPGPMAYVKGRLMVAGRSTDKHKIWNITQSGNNPGALYTHPNTSFEWVGFAAGQNFIYAAGHSGNKTIIYKITIQPDGTSLTIPTVAAELPLGEIVVGLDGYLGFVVIGLENGFRFCSADGNGNLVVGPLIETGAAVRSFAGIGQYLYFGWTNFDDVSTGIGRMDVATQIVSNQPAYASDLMVNGQGTVVDVHEFDGQPVFTVADDAPPDTLVRTNLSTNPSFETNDTGWEVNADATFSRVTTDAFVGSGSGRVVNTATGGGAIRIDNTATHRIPVIPGDVISASAYFKNTVGTRNLRVTVRFFANATTTTLLAFTDGTPVINPTTWTRGQVISAVAPNNALWADLLIGTSNTGSIGDTWLFDAVLIEKNQPVGQPYFDGGTADTWTFPLVATAWTGTTNNSTSTATFNVGAGGAYRPSTDKVPSGYLDSGIYRWGVPDGKFIPKWDIRTIPLRGTIQLLVAADGGSFRSVGTQAVVNSLEATFDGFEDRVFEAEARIVMTRCPTACEKGPQLTRWLGRAYAAPLRSQIFSVPLLLHHVLQPKNGQDYWVDVDDELSRLRDLVENPRVVAYQENYETYSVVVEDVRWSPVDSFDANSGWSWDGTCVVILRSVR